LNYVGQVCLGSDGAKGAVVDAVAALDAFFFVDFAVAPVVIGNRSDRAGFFAGPLQVNYGAVWAGFGAKAAFLAFGGIYVHPHFAGRDGVKMAGAKAGTPHAKAAVVGDGIRRNRAVVAGRVYHLNHVLAWRHVGRTFGAGKADSLADNLALLVNAAILGLGAGNHFVNQLVLFLFVKLAFPRKTANFFHYLMLEPYNSCVVCNHRRILPYFAEQSKRPAQDKRYMETVKKCAKKRGGWRRHSLCACRDSGRCRKFQGAMRVERSYQAAPNGRSRDWEHFLLLNP
jgi:hypothetical protein